MAIVKVTPREGARIRQPNRNYRVMPPEGDMVSTDDVFYARLIQSGDVEIIEEKPKADEAKEAKKK